MGPSEIICNKEVPTNLVVVVAVVVAVVLVNFIDLSNYKI